ncbi:hypothetical protein O988_03022 [Pseudogymnoascus sp. VKM F-3808]|nr:hypothetical protein O988_03022 [Pseudogymnoascus sp. VKM F-3808]
MSFEHATKVDNLTSMHDCLKTGAFSDLTITCGDMTWNAHRVVVCPKSSFFRAACVGNFKEAVTGIISLEDDNPLAVNFMMDYIYTNDYTINKQPKDVLSRLRMHVQVYCLGDKYDIVGLRRMATFSYEDVLDEATFEEFLASIPEVYLPQASNGLRKSAINHMRRARATETWTDESKSNLKRVMKDVPEFGSDLIEDFITAPVKGRCRECGSHDTKFVVACADCGSEHDDSETTF